MKMASLSRKLGQKKTVEETMKAVVAKAITNSVVMAQTAQARGAIKGQAQTTRARQETIKGLMQTPQARAHRQETIKRQTMVTIEQLNKQRQNVLLKAT
jgi:hypothetical protein